MQTNVNLEIKKLLDRHRATLLREDNKNGLCYDGIVDEKTYFDKENKCPIAFLLKETNATDKNGMIPDVKENWDYIGWLNYNQLHKIIRNPEHENESLYKTYHNLCMWIKEFYDLLDKKAIAYKDYTYEKEECGALNIPAVRHMLGQIAIVNLKKTWGNNATPWKDLNAYLTDKNGITRTINPEIQHILQKEIKLISPKIVFCGGRQVYDFARMIFTEDSCPAKELDTVANCFLFENTLFVSFRHPACRGRRKEQFDYAKDIFNQIIELMHHECI